MNKTQILILNGSIRGKTGNCASVAAGATAMLERLPDISVSTLVLADPMPALGAVQQSLLAADAFLVVSGVYWNSWGSPLQRFLEVATIFENGAEFFGKPLAAVVTMDSVGGTDVAARMHASFSGLGCWSPPCSTLVVSRVAEYAVAQTARWPEDPNEDVWRIADLEVVLRNLVTAARLRGEWVAWDKTALRLEGGDWPGTGSLDLGSLRFL